MEPLLAAILQVCIVIFAIWVVHLSTYSHQVIVIKRFAMINDPGPCLA